MRNSHGDMLQVIHDYMSDPETAWSICGAGEFVRRDDTPTEMWLDHTGGCLATANCAVRIMINPMTRLAPREALTREDDLWVQGALFCLPSADAAMSRRTGVTELGNDMLAVRPKDRVGILFDLGIGGPTVDVCVRTADPELCKFLRARLGAKADAAVQVAIDNAKPDHVILSRLGRVEGFGARPEPTPIFDRLRAPDGLHACLAFMSPQRLESGEMNQVTFETFQILLDDFADPVLLQCKQSVFAAVRAGTGPEAMPICDAVQRDVIRLALRQLRYLDGPSDALTAWLEVFD